MEKLIRDNVHIIAHAEYKHMQLRQVASIEEHVQFLVAKIIEEQEEFEKATGDKKIGEAGDLLEIYDTLIDIYTNYGHFREREEIIHKREILFVMLQNLGISIEQALSIQQSKRKERGGFKKGIIWIH